MIAEKAKILDIGFLWDLDPSILRSVNWNVKFKTETNI